MRVFANLTTFTRFVESLAIAATPLAVQGVGSVGALLYASAYKNFGNSSKFVPLADSTLLARANRWGYYKQSNVGDGTLLWTGRQRGEIEYAQDGLTAGVGTADPIMLYQELGTPRIPPRPLFKISAEEVIPESEELVRIAAGRMIGVYLPGG